MENANVHDCSRYVERVFWVVKGNI
jgi:hypothetical protein